MQKQVTELKEGDMVDMEGRYTEPDDIVFAECQYAVVDSIEQETPECLLVHFNEHPSFGFPTAEMVEVAGSDENG